MTQVPTLSAAAQATFVQSVLAQAALCTANLKDAQQYATLTAAAYTTIQQDWSQLSPLLVQIQSLLATLQTSAGTLAEWTQMQGLAQQANVLLADIAVQAERASEIAANATVIALQAAQTCDLVSIDAAVAQAQASAASAVSASGSYAVLFAAIAVQGAIATPAPAVVPPPAPAVPALTAACFSASEQTTFFIPTGVDLKMSESCTQQLVNALNTLGGQPSLSSFMQNLFTLVAAIAGAVVTGPIGVTIVAVITAVLEGLIMEAELLSAVITEADVNKKGITLHFSLIPLGIGLAVAPGAIGLLIPANELALAAETQVSGGTGSKFIDLFWITGN